MTALPIGSVVHTPLFIDDGPRAIDSWHRVGISAYTGARGNSTVRAGLSRANFGYRNEATS